MEKPINSLDELRLSQTLLQLDNLEVYKKSLEIVHRDTRSVSFHDSMKFYKAWLF